MQNNSISGLAPPRGGPSTGLPRGAIVSPRGGPGIGALATGLPRETIVLPRGGPSTGLPRGTLTTKKSKKPVRLSAPVFVPATKDALLLKNMQEEENKVGEITGWKYKLVERSGVLLRELLTRSNPWDTSPCGRKNCLACPMAKKPLNCKRRSLMYESTCKECVDAKGEPTVKYVGETARSGSERWGDHMRDARNKAPDSHVYKHWQNEHAGRETEFQFQIIKFFSSPLDRQEDWSPQNTKQQSCVQ